MTPEIYIPMVQDVGTQQTPLEHLQYAVATQVPPLLMSQPQSFCQHSLLRSTDIEQDPGDSDPSEYKQVARATSSVSHARFLWSLASS